MTTLTLNEAADFLRQGDDFLILTHGRPDGDTIGSGSALCRLLRRLGKQAFLLPNEDLTPRLDFLYGDLLAPEGFVPGAVVATDVATRELLCKTPRPLGIGWICASTTTPPTQATPKTPCWTPAVRPPES